MATPVKSAKYATLGVSAGPDASVLLDATNIDANADLEFQIIGPAEGVELVIISGTAKTGAPSVVFNVQRFDLASGTWVTLLASAAVLNSGTTQLLVSHHAPNSANVSAAHCIGERMRLDIAYTGTPVTDVLNNVTATVQVI